MKLRIKYELKSKSHYYWFTNNDENYLIKRHKDNIKYKKKIHACLKRHLHKKLFNISKTLNISGWNVFCIIEENWITKNHVLKLNIQSFDKILSGDLSIDVSNQKEVEVQPEVKYSGILAWMNAWSFSGILNNQLTIDKIKDKNTKLELNMRLIANSPAYNKECFFSLKEQYDSIFDYLKLFEIKFLYDHRLKIKEKDIYWHPTYLRLENHEDENEDDQIKQIIDFVMKSSIARKNQKPNYYSIKDISNNTILKTLFEKNILDINIFDGDKKEVTKEDIKEYFELNDMCSY